MARIHNWERRDGFPVRSPFRDPLVPLAPEQLELRRLVLKQVDTHPDTFDMDNWEEEEYVGETACKTTRCIAGWAQYFARGAVIYACDDRDVEVDGIKLLGLTRDEYAVWGSKGLFYASNAAALERLRTLAGSDWDD